MTAQQSGNPADPLAAPQQPAPMETIRSDDTQNPQNQTVLGLGLFVLAAAASGFLMVGALGELIGIKTPMSGFYETSKRLTHFWPETSDARGSCETSGGHNAWTNRGITVFIPASGHCANLTREEAQYLLDAYPDSRWPAVR